MRRVAVFLEDDHCQQQLLPRASAPHVVRELSAIASFAREHQDPAGFGWTDVYVRGEAPEELSALALPIESVATVLSTQLSVFDAVSCATYPDAPSSRRTAAWGISNDCVVYVDWDADRIVQNIWTSFFDVTETAVAAAAGAMAALAAMRPMIYVDWAWGFVCDPSDPLAFTALLREKLHSIERRPAASTKS